jgi:hypothetical protein
MLLQRNDEVNVNFLLISSSGVGALVVSSVFGLVSNFTSFLVLVASCSFLSLLSVVIVGSGSFTSGGFTSVLTILQNAPSNKCEEQVKNQS